MKWSLWLARLAATMSAIVAAFGPAIAWVSDRKEAAYSKAVQQAPWSLALSPLEGGENDTFKASLSVGDFARNRFKVLSVGIRNPRGAKLSYLRGDAKDREASAVEEEQEFADRIAPGAEMAAIYKPLPEGGGISTSSSIEFLVRLRPGKSAGRSARSTTLRIWVDLEEMALTRRACRIEVVSDPLE